MTAPAHEKCVLCGSTTCECRRLAEKMADCSQLHGFAERVRKGMTPQMAADAATGRVAEA